MAGLSEEDLKLIERFVDTPPAERRPDLLRPGTGDGDPRGGRSCPACGRAGDGADGDCPACGASMGK